LLQADGTFEFQSLTEGFHYTLGFTAGSLPANVYVEDMRQGDRSIYDSATPDISGATLAPVEIMLASGGGVVRASLLNAKGEPNVMPVQPWCSFLRSLVAAMPC
jgi:hypothetical protein